MAAPLRDNSGPGSVGVQLSIRGGNNLNTGRRYCLDNLPITLTANAIVDLNFNLASVHCCMKMEGHELTCTLFGIYLGYLLKTVRISAVT